MSGVVWCLSFCVCLSSRTSSSTSVAVTDRVSFSLGLTLHTVWLYQGLCSRQLASASASPTSWRLGIGLQCTWESGCLFHSTDLSPSELHPLGVGVLGRRECLMLSIVACSSLHSRQHRARIQTPHFAQTSRPQSFGW